MSKNNFWVVLMTLLIALLLSILPLPSFANWVRPLWVRMVLCYWTIALEYRIGMGLTFSSGILLDILGGSLLGEHAFALCLIIFVTEKLQRQIRLAPIGQQSIIMGVLSFVYLLMIYLFQGMTGHAPASFLFWLPMITTGLFWPWVFILLRDCRRRFSVK